MAHGRHMRALVAEHIVLVVCAYLPCFQLARRHRSNPSGVRSTARLCSASWFLH